MPARIRIIGKRQMGCQTRESYRRSAGRASVTEQNICRRMRNFTATMPCIENRIKPFGNSLHGNRSAIEEHAYKRLSECFCPPQYAFFIIRNGNIGNAGILSRAVWIFTERKYNGIRIGQSRFAIPVIAQSPIGQLLLHRFAKARGFRCIAVKRPTAVQSLPFLCTFANQKNLRILPERQNSTRVFQKHRSLCRKIARRFPVCGKINRMPLAIRMLKQSLCLLDAQNPPDRAVNRFHRKPSLAHGFFPIRKIAEVYHIHIDPGIQRQGSRLAVILCYAAANQLMHRAVIRDNHAVKTEMPTKNVRQVGFACADWLAVNVVKSGHYSQNTRADCRAESGQIGVIQCIIGNLRMTVVSATLRSAVTDKMLRAGKHAAGGVRPLSL